MQTTASKCNKCDGTGKVLWKHVDNGRCFECNGSGKCVARHVDVQKVTTQRNPAQERQSFINRFAGAIRMIKAEGKGFLSELHDDQAPELGTERDNIRAWLNSAKCPADVRARAVAAFVSLGVEF